MLPLVYTWSVYALVFWIIYLVWFVLEMIGAIRQRVQADAQKQDRGSLIVLGIGLYVGLFLNFFLAGLLPGAVLPGNHLVVFISALVLIILGMLLRQYAIQTLGQYFTRQVATRTDQQVVQQGPYRLIRHPAYSGTLLTILGIGLAVTNWVSLLVLLFCTLVGYTYRVLVEEQALRTALGQPYMEYMQRTKRFIPFLW